MITEEKSMITTMGCRCHAIGFSCGREGSDKETVSGV